MNPQDQLYKLKLQLGNSDDLDVNLLLIMLEDAKDYILGYTRRTETQWRTVFDPIQRQIATININRLGVEGVASRGEGSISTSFLGVTDYPDSIVKQLNPYRLIK